jgi:hypothetical protein
MRRRWMSWRGIRCLLRHWEESVGGVDEGTGDVGVVKMRSHHPYLRE